MLKTSQLEIFVTVVDCGTLSRAAERLNTSQPYLSRVLRSVEEEMGKRLLERGKRGVVPTKEGKFLYDYAKSALRNLKKIEELKGMDLERDETRLSVCLYSFFINPDLFLKFVSGNLTNSVHLSVRENNMSVMFERLRGRQSELGIAVVNDVEFPAVQNAANAGDLSCEMLDVSPLYVHVGVHHRACELEKVSIGDLIYSTYLHIPFDQYSRSRLEIEIDGRRMKEFKQVMAVDHNQLMIDLLREKDCFIFGNKWQKDTMSRYGIKSKLMENTRIRMHLILFRRNEELSREGEKFMDLFRAEYLHGDNYN